MHSGTMLLQARKAYERSQRESWDAMTSILLSALALECFVNELDELIANRVLDDAIPELISSRIVTALLEESKASLIPRIDAYHFALRGKPIDRGQGPMQDLKFLIQLRNALVHRKSERMLFPVTDGDGARKTHKFVSYLAARKIIPKSEAHVPGAWSQYVLVPSVAMWAHNTVVDLTMEIVSWLPEGNFKCISEVRTNNCCKITVEQPQVMRRER